MSDHIEVTGRGTAAAAPDVVVVTARVQCEAPSVAVVLSLVAERANAVFAAAGAAGVGATDRQTVTIGIQQRYDQQGQRIVGHIGYQTMRLLCRDRGGVGAVLTALAQAGGNDLSIEGVNLELSETSALLVTARERAFADAAATAAQLAGLAGRGLGEVTKITDASVDVGHPQTRMFAMAAEAAFMPVEGGSAEVSVSLRVRWNLV